MNKERTPNNLPTDWRKWSDASLLATARHAIENNDDQLADTLLAELESRDRTKP